MAAIETLRKGLVKPGKTILELADAAEGDIRVLACGLLGDVKPHGALGVLIEKTHDRDPNVREAACAALGKFRSARAASSLMEALGDGTWTAYAAACSLGAIGGKQALQRLFELFRDGDHLMATAACQALLDRNDPDIIGRMGKTLREWPRRKRNRFVMVILEYGSEEALNGLSDIFGHDLLAHLRSLIHSERKAPIRVLSLGAQFKNREAVSLMLQELAKRDPEADDYQKIMALLLELAAVWGDQPEDYFDTGRPGSVFAMIEACARTRKKIGEGFLRDIFSRSPRDTKREIAKNLPLIAGPSFRMVEELLSDADDHIKGYAAEAASFFGMRKLASRVEELARTGYADTRQKAFRSLAVLNPRKAKALAEEFVRQGDGEDKRVYLSGAELIDKELNYGLISALLKSREKSVVAQTVTVMGRLIEEDSRYLAVIEGLLGRKRILPQTLKIIRQNRLTCFQPKLLNLLEKSPGDPWSRYRILSVLAEMEDQNLFDVFAAGLKDEHNLVKIAGIKGLAGLRDPRAIEIISPFLTIEDADVSHAAKAAMSVLGGGNDDFAPTGKC